MALIACERGPKLEDAQAALAAGNTVRAVEIFRDLADDGDGDAQAALGRLLALGNGIDEDDSAAAELYLLAAEQGHIEAQLDLATAYLGGFGVERDFGQAARWFNVAAAEGNARAQYNMGLLNNAGNGVMRDQSQAYMWFTLAASGGSQDAQRMLVTLERNLTEEQIIEAGRRLGEWREAHIAE